MKQLLLSKSNTKSFLHCLTTSLIIQTFIDKNTEINLIDQTDKKIDLWSKHISQSSKYGTS